MTRSSTLSSHIVAVPLQAYTGSVSSDGYSMIRSQTPMIAFYATFTFLSDSSLKYPAVTHGEKQITFQILTRS